MPRENLQRSVREKENELMAQNQVEDGSSSEPIVDQTRLEREMDSLDRKVSESPLSEKYKKEVSGALEEFHKNWAQKIDNFRVDQGDIRENEFKALFDEMLNEMSNFEKQEKVREIFEIIAPFFERESDVRNIIQLQSYSRKSGDWKEINDKLADLGFDEEKIKTLQTLLRVKSDGQVGPETIMAIYREIYETPREIKWDKMTVYETPSPKDSDDHRTTPTDEALGKLDEEHLSALESAKTIDEVQKASIENQKAYDQMIELEDESIDLSNKEAEIQKAREALLTLRDELQLSESSFRVYLEEYVSAPENERIPISEIKETLSALKSRYLDGQEETYVTLLLAEAFGKLINGYKTNLLPDFLAELVLLEEEIAKQESLLGKLEQAVDRNLRGLAKGIKENPHLHEFWEPSKDEWIDASIEGFYSAQNAVIEVSEKLVKLREKERALTISILRDKYHLKKAEGGDMDEFLLEIRSRLGPDIPQDDFTDDVNGAIQRKIDDPNTPEYERLFYQGKTAEAVESLSKNFTRDVILAGGFTSHDICSFYARVESGDLPKRTFPSGSFAQKKISNEEYIAPKLEGRGGDDLFLIIKKKGDKIGYYYVDIKGDLVRQLHHQHGGRKPYIIDNVSQIQNKDTEISKEEDIMMRMLSEDPVFNTLNTAVKMMTGKIKNLQNLFASGLQGRKTEDFVWLARQYAREIKFSPELDKLKKLMPHARGVLNSMARFSQQNVAELERRDSEIKNKIREMEGTFSKVEHHMDIVKLENFCDQIISSNFNADDFLKWALDKALPFLTSILIACVAIALICTGVGGVMGVILVGAVGTVGGMAGNELGHLTSHSLGRGAGLVGDDYENRTDLQRVFSDEKVFNTQTGRYEKLDHTEVLKQYGSQALMGFITTCALLGLGKMAGSSLSKFVARHAGNKGGIGQLARILGKLPRLNVSKIDPVKAQRIQLFHKRLLKEFIEEVGEESSENLGEKIHPIVGFLVSTYNAMDGRRMESMLGKFQVVQVKEANIATGLESRWAYDANQRTEFINYLQNEYGKTGTTEIEVDTDNNVRLEQSFIARDGTVFSNTLLFSPSSMNIPMQHTLSRNPEARDMYGIKPVEGSTDSSYTYDNFSPDGKINLRRFMKSNGFVEVRGDARDGTMVFMKRNSKIVLRPSSVVESSGVAVDTATDAVVGTESAVDTATDAVAGTIGVTPSQQSVDSTSDTAVDAVAQVLSAEQSAESTINSETTTDTVAQTQSIDLNQIETLNKEQAIQIVNSAERGKVLSLPKLKSITPDVAAELAKHNGPLRLNGLKTISPEVAAELANYNGLLSLDGLKTISPEVATALASHKGVLSLAGLKTISIEIAEILATHNGELYLDGLKNISLKVANILIKKPEAVFMSGLSEDSKALWEATLAVESRVFSLDLSNIKRVSVDLATKLSEYNGNVWLDNVETISLRVAKLLSKGNGDLWLNKLSNASISPQIIAELAKRNGTLGLNGLENVNLELAEAFANHNGNLWLSGVGSITQDVANALAKKRSGNINMPNLNTESKIILEMAIGNKLFADTDAYIESGNLHLIKILNEAQAQLIFDKYHNLNLVQLDGLEVISVKVATVFSKHPGFISLNGIRIISPEVASILSTQYAYGTVLMPNLDAGSRNLMRGTRISATDTTSQINRRTLRSELTPAEVDLAIKSGDFSLIRTLNKEQAEQIISQNPRSIALFSLETLNLDVAEVLIKHTGYLGLPNLENLSPEVAEVLAKHKGPLEIGLLNLPLSVSQKLETHEGPLYLNRLKVVDSPALASSIARHEGPVYLMGLKGLAKEIYTELSKKSSVYISLAARLDRLAFESDLDATTDFKGIYQWMSAQGDMIQGVSTNQLIGVIQNYEQSDGKSSIDQIPQGPLRDKVFDIMETKNIGRIQQEMAAEREAVEIELVQAPTISTADPRKVDNLMSLWMTTKLADRNHGQLLDETNARAFSNDRPMQMNLEFKSGTKISVLFPSTYSGFMESFTGDIVRMEQWIQTQFAERGLRPSENLTILITNDAPGAKPVRGAAGGGHIIINGTSAFRGSQNSLDLQNTYLHERTHSILEASSLSPFNSGIVEGIANYMGARGTVELGFGQSRAPSRDAIGHNQVLESMMDGRTFKDALWDYLKQDLTRTNYNLNYEYGEAFVEAFVGHHRGNISQLLKVYSELTHFEYARSQHPGTLLTEGMTKIGISATDIDAILTQTAGNLLLRSFRGPVLMDVLLRRPGEEIDYILGPEQRLEAIFGVEMPTIRQLGNLVFQAERSLISSSIPRIEGIDPKIIQKRAGLIIKRLRKLLNSRRVQAGLGPI